MKCSILTILVILALVASCTVDAAKSRKKRQKSNTPKNNLANIFQSGLKKKQQFPCMEKEVIRMRSFGKDDESRRLATKDMTKLERAIKKSKIPNKSEVLRLMSSVFNPKNRTPAGLILLMKRISPDTGGKLLQIMLEHVQSNLQEACPEEFSKIEKYIHNDDAIRLHVTLSEIFHEIKARDITWFFREVLQKKKVAPNSENALEFVGDKDKKVFEFRDEEAFRDYVAERVREIQKINAFQRFSSHAANLTSAVRDLVLHQLEPLLDDLQEQWGPVNAKEIIENILSAKEKGEEGIKNLLDIMDPEDIMHWVETTVESFSNFNETEAKKAFFDLREYFAGAAEMMSMFGEDQTTKSIAAIMTQISNYEIPEEKIDKLVKLFMKISKRFNPNTAKFIAQRMVKLKEGASSKELMIKQVTNQMIKDETLKRVNKYNSKEMKNSILEKLRKINPEGVNNIAQLSSRAIQKMSPTNIANFLLDANKVGKDFTYIMSSMGTPSKESFVRSLNESVLENVVRMNIDGIKLIDIPLWTAHCKLYIDSGAKNKLIAAIHAFEQHLRNSGAPTEKAHEILKITSIADVLISTMDFQSSCQGPATMLSVAKALDDKAIKEIVAMLWSQVEKATQSIAEGGNVADAVKQGLLIANAVPLLLSDGKRVGPETTGAIVKMVTDNLKRSVRKRAVDKRNLRKGVE